MVSVCLLRCHQHENLEDLIYPFGRDCLILFSLQQGAVRRKPFAPRLVVG